MITWLYTKICVWFHIYIYISYMCCMLSRFSCLTWVVVKFTEYPFSFLNISIGFTRIVIIIKYRIAIFGVFFQPLLFLFDSLTSSFLLFHPPSAFESHLIFISISSSSPYHIISYNLHLISISTQSINHPIIQCIDYDYSANLISCPSPLHSLIPSFNLHLHSSHLISAHLHSLVHPII